MNIMDMNTDAIWKLLNEADDHITTWSAYAWQQWFAQIVDAVSSLDSDIARIIEIDEDGFVSPPVVGPIRDGGNS
jgi:hypothetical protein